MAHLNSLFEDGKRRFVEVFTEFMVVISTILFQQFLWQDLKDEAKEVIMSFSSATKEEQLFLPSFINEDCLTMLGLPKDEDCLTVRICLGVRICLSTFLPKSA